MKALTSIFDETLTGYIEPVSQCEINKRLTTGTCKGVAVICCSEMGSVNSTFPDHPDLPIYTWQNLGGCVKDCGGLEELIARNEITDVIVFGHYGCEIIEVGLRSDPSGDHATKRIYEEVVRRTYSTRTAMKERFGDKFDKHIFHIAVEDFVLRELAILLNLPVVSKAASEGLLRAHAWVNCDDTVESACYDPKTQTFWVLPDDCKR